MRKDIQIVNIDKGTKFCINRRCRCELDIEDKYCQYCDTVQLDLSKDIVRDSVKR